MEKMAKSVRSDILFEVNSHFVDVGWNLRAVNDNDIVARSSIQVYLAVPNGRSDMEFQFVHCSGGHVNNIDITVGNLLFGSQVVVEFPEQIEQTGLRHEMLERFSGELCQVVWPGHIDLSPPEAFPLRRDSGNAIAEQNNSVTVPKSENREAWASEAKPEKPKNADLRCVSTSAFTLFSRAVPIGFCHPYRWSGGGY